MYAIEELREENIVITDETGLILNDFEDTIIRLPEWNVQEA